MADRSQVADVFAAAADAMGGLDCYVGNAGITRDRMFHRLSDDDWDQVIAVNLTGVYAGLRGRLSRGCGATRPGESCSSPRSWPAPETSAR